MQIKCTWIASCEATKPESLTRLTESYFLFCLVLLIGNFGWTDSTHTHAAMAHRVRSIWFELLKGREKNFLWLINSFTCFVCLFDRSYVHSFIHSLIQVIHLFGARLWYAIVESMGAILFIVNSHFACCHIDCLSYDIDIHIVIDRPIHGGFGYIL